jgi:hypothetical protein
MYDRSAIGNTDGYYAGLEVVDNPTTEYVSFFSFDFRRHKVNDAACSQCADGCVVNLYDLGLWAYTTYPVPCYLKFDFSNHKDNTSCTYPYTKDCDALNGIWFASFVGSSSDYLTSTFSVDLCRTAPITTQWAATVGHGYNYTTATYGYYFEVFNTLESQFKKWFVSMPDMFSWVDEVIPYVFYTYQPTYCIDLADPPVLKVSYADLAVP